MSFSRNEKLLLGILALAQFSHIVDFMIIMPLGPLLMRLFVVGPHEFGLLVSIYTLCAAGSGFLSAGFIDRFDRKHALQVAYAGFALGTLFCAAASSYPILLIARGITGAFGGILNSLVLSIVGDKIPFERRGAAMGIIMTAFSLASVFGVPFGLLLSSTFSWHAPFIFLGIFSLLACIAIERIVPPIREHFARQKSESLLTPFRLALSSPNQLRALALIFIMMLAGFSVIPFLSPSMVANAGLPESQLGFIYLVGGVSSIISGPIVGRLADYFGVRNMFVVMALISVIPVLIVTHLGLSPVWLTLSVAASLFVCLSGRMIPAQALITSTVHPQHRGGFMSISSGLQQTGAALGSYIASVIVERGPAGTLLHYPVVGFFSAACTVLGVIISIKIKPFKHD